MRIFEHIWVLTLVLFLMGPSILQAYTIVLKDGSTIQSKTKYEIRGDKAYILLVNGTQTVLDLNEINIEKTDETNLMDVGDALLIDGGEVRLINPKTELKKKELSLTELSRIAREAKATAELENETDDQTEILNLEDLPRTLSGNIDLLGLPRRLYRSEIVIRAFATAFAELEALDSSFYDGTQNSRLFIEVITNDEDMVFALLKATSEVFLSLDQAQKGVPETVELLLLSGGRERAGQFAIDRVRAEELTSEAITVQRFFLQYVEF